MRRNVFEIKDDEEEQSVDDARFTAALDDPAPDLVDDPAIGEHYEDDLVDEPEPAPGLELADEQPAGNGPARLADAGVLPLPPEAAADHGHEPDPPRAPRRRRPYASGAAEPREPRRQRPRTRPLADRARAAVEGARERRHGRAERPRARSSARGPDARATTTAGHHDGRWRVVAIGAIAGLLLLVGLNVLGGSDAPSSPERDLQAEAAQERAERRAERRERRAERRRAEARRRAAARRRARLRPRGTWAWRCGSVRVRQSSWQDVPRPGGGK